MDWSTRRQLTILLGILAVVMLGILFLFWRVALVNQPTCTDGLQNGDERGVDCGGSCQLLCQDETTDPVVLWARAIPSVGNTYHLVAYIENTNKTAIMVQAPYVFSVFGDRLGEEFYQEGEYTLLPNQRSVVFLSRVALDFEPKEAFFEFTEEPLWQQFTPPNSAQIIVDGVQFGYDALVPSLGATLRNPTFDDFKNVEIVALGYNTDNNLMLASRTFVDLLGATTEEEIAFTWPEEVATTEPERFEFIIMVEPVAETQ